MGADQKLRWNVCCPGADLPWRWNVCVLGGCCSATESEFVCVRWALIKQLWCSMIAQQQRVQFWMLDVCSAAMQATSVLDACSTTVHAA